MKKKSWLVILEYKRRLLKSRPSEQKVGIEGISTTSQEEASAEARNGGGDGGGAKAGPSGMAVGREKERQLRGRAA